MMAHCLTPKEYKELINVNYLNQKQAWDFEYVQPLYESCIYWEHTLIGVNYFLSLAIESLQKNIEVEPELLKFIYDLQERASFKVEEFPTEFIDVLLRTHNIEDVTLEDKIIEIQGSLYE